MANHILSLTNYFIDLVMVLSLSLRSSHSVYSKGDKLESNLLNVFLFPLPPRLLLDADTGKPQGNYELSQNIVKHITYNAFPLLFGALGLNNNKIHPLFVCFAH